MKKKIEKWQISTLIERINTISFPEYQREPNIWNKLSKQRLIDSITRHFDIAPIYFYRRDNDLVNCVDGRQRISAIMSFLGENEKDKDNNFNFRSINELYEDSPVPFESLQNSSFTKIKTWSENGTNTDAKTFINRFMNYRFTVVVLSETRDSSEFNLQFTRLNFGLIINSGEKLNAMVGDLRDLCFDDLGQHEFLQLINMPERRYSREQTVAQILAQIFSLEDNNGHSDEPQFTKTRYFDLQALFKKHASMSKRHREISERIRSLFDLMTKVSTDLSEIRSRALIVSFVLLAYRQQAYSVKQLSKMGKFMRELGRRLKWQLSKGLHVDPEYYYLIEFQKHVTQASVEKPAVTERARLLEKAFSTWLDDGVLEGDEEYKKRTKENPGNT